MMKSVANLNQYRAYRKKIWLKKHAQNLNSFFHDYIVCNIGISYQKIYESYQNTQYIHAEVAWDYVDFRESLITALEESVLDHLYEELKYQNWFDYKIISKEEIIDRFVSLYITMND